MLARGLPGATSGGTGSAGASEIRGTAAPVRVVQFNMAGLVDMAGLADRESRTGESETALLVRLLVGKYGDDAPAVALARARLCRRSRTYAAALVWLELALLADGQAAPPAVVSRRRGDDDALRVLVRRLRQRHRDRG
jgi:hypothetical protein